ncbi:DNA-binding response regulator [Bdellovibrio bacteriovorus]|uniref:DNA-binding response regulator n=1 Tax=Bdellovibrio bacteriovorus TaxID=959 RepID=A0A150WJT7_BDEBC|nr:response regulator transcription factor [Bdellovibrio bacteriovorus]KYG64028.1 DNA-binding response regulator [Bdellovibrio bacteriovorus]
MNEGVRILIVDDEAPIRNVLRLHLSEKGYKLSEAKTAAEALEQASGFHPHLVILDLGLPDKDGYEVLKELRAWTTVPVLVLTATDDESTKIRLLDKGADDYLTKPFSPGELLARVRVCLRHSGTVEATPIFESGDLRIDLNARLVTVDGVPIKLTSTEYEVLARLAREPGKVVAQNTLLRQIWGVTAEDQTHYLRIYIKQLRKKIEKIPSEPVHILTEPGVGYRLI